MSFTNRQKHSNNAESSPYVPYQKQRCLHLHEAFFIFGKKFNGGATLIFKPQIQIQMTPAFHWENIIRIAAMAYEPNQ